MRHNTVSRRVRRWHRAASPAKHVRAHLVQEVFAYALIGELAESLPEAHGRSREQELGKPSKTVKAGITPQPAACDPLLGQQKKDISGCRRHTRAGLSPSGETRIVVDKASARRLQG